MLHQPNRRLMLLGAGASAAARLSAPATSAVPSRSLILPSAFTVSETLARFCRYLCASATTLPDALRRQMSALAQSRAQPFSPELERSQAERLARTVLRVFASEALHVVDLEYEARECEAAETDPIAAAYAASRAEIDIHYMTTEGRGAHIEVLGQVALNASHAYWRAIGDSDTLVPMAGDYAALAVIAWELPKPTPGSVVVGWLWRSAAAAIEECLTVARPAA